MNHVYGMVLQTIHTLNFKQVYKSLFKSYHTPKKLKINFSLKFKQKDKNYVI